MNVGELIEVLEKFPLKQAEVYVSSDGEGNSIRPFFEVVEEWAFINFPYREADLIHEDDLGEYGDDITKLAVIFPV